MACGTLKTDDGSSCQDVAKWNRSFVVKRQKVGHKSSWARPWRITSRHFREIFVDYPASQEGEAMGRILLKPPQLPFDEVAVWDV